MAVLTTIGAVLGSTVGKKVIDKMLDVVEKKIPMTKDQKEELQAELAKTNLEIAKTEIQAIEAKGRFIKIVTGAMPLIAWILPLMVLSLAIAFNYQFWSDVYYTRHGMEAPIYNLDSRWFEMGNTFIQYLFYGKIAGKLSPFHDSDKDYGNKLLNKLYR